MSFITLLVLLVLGYTYPIMILKTYLKLGTLEKNCPVLYFLKNRPDFFWCNEAITDRPHSTVSNRSKGAIALESHKVRSLGGILLGVTEHK